ADHLEVVLHDGQGVSPLSNRRAKPAGEETFDWSFEVWVPASWRQLFNAKESFFGSDDPRFGRPVAAPRLDVWLRPNGPDWQKISVLPHLTVRDTRATSHGYEAGAGSVIRAVVTDFETGQPINSARLAADESGEKGYKPGLAATGDNSGHIELSHLLAATY